MTGLDKLAQAVAMLNLAPISCLPELVAVAQAVKSAIADSGGEAVSTPVVKALAALEEKLGEL